MRKVYVPFGLKRGKRIWPSKESYLNEKKRFFSELIVKDINN